ncbi:MAG: Fe-S-containing hydro-lyase [Candidatus Omnitrophica bacterium]|nr:Fe-S-containing hydro-lyase [Candidatus Omnitrophota bacterium]
MKPVKITTPLLDKDIKKLKAGQEVLISGYLYTARDAAHKRIVELISKKKKLPLNLRDNIIYYCGPNPAPPGEVIGSAGPTTSSRMDSFTPCLLKAGLKAMIGKGKRSEETRQAIKKYKAVYFIALAGGGAFLSQRIKAVRPIAFAGLGTEAIYEFQVKDFPLIVGIDSKGNDIYTQPVLIPQKQNGHYVPKRAR